MTETLTSRRLTLETQGPLARITFTHPPLNVFDLQLMDEMAQALEGLKQRSEISAVVISGSERAFSAGVDVAVHTPELIQTMFQKYHCGSSRGVPGRRRGAGHGVRYVLYHS